MKGDFPRVEVQTPDYRFFWHGRFFGFRLVSTSGLPYDDRITYSNFGPFEVGGVDLVCNHYQPVTLAWPGGEEIKLFGARLNLAEPQEQVVRVDHFDDKKRLLRVEFHFSATAPHIRMRIDPAGFDTDKPMLLSLPGNLIYDRKWQGTRSAAFYSSGVKTGLQISGAEEGSVRIADSQIGKTLICRVPLNQPSDWAFTVLGANAQVEKLPDHAAVKASAQTFRPVKINELKSWESEVLRQRGWKPERTGVKERVAGVYVSAEGWHNPVSWLPESRIDYIDKTFLRKLIDARCFEAVGFSRDGVTEKGENAAWLKLVEKTHRAGLRVYLKPGDSEITAMTNREQIAAWAKLVFDVPAIQRCDVIRMPWEAVLVPWTNANLCLPARFHTPELARLQGLPWREVSERIVASVADRFSFVIEAIRRYAPQVTIDLESTDSPVLERLVKRHENLGVMYMAYGQYPRAAEYLDVYQCVARNQAKAARVVLETDCYYTASITGLGQLKGRPYTEMYSEQDIALMAQKHHHMNALSAAAAWAWGTNITFTEAKFRAVCAAGR